MSNSYRLRVPERIITTLDSQTPTSFKQDGPMSEEPHGRAVQENLRAAKENLEDARDLVKGAFTPVGDESKAKVIAAGVVISPALAVGVVAEVATAAKNVLVDVPVHAVLSKLNKPRDNWED